MGFIAIVGKMFPGLKLTGPLNEPDGEEEPHRKRHHSNCKNPRIKDSLPTGQRDRTKGGGTARSFSNDDGGTCPGVAEEGRSQ